MNKKILKLVLPALFAVSALTGCDPNSEPKFYQLPTGMGQGYYSDFNFDLVGRNMLKQIHLQSFKKHTYWVPYGDVNSYRFTQGTRKSTDAIPGKEGKIELFYTGKVVREGESGLNREHVWPAANSAGLWDHDTLDDAKVEYVGGGSDLYHVRPCDGDVNTARGNSRFIDFDDFPDKMSGSKYIHEKYQGGPYGIRVVGFENQNSYPEFAKFCEPDDEMKGDIARLICYVYSHYSKIGTDASISEIDPKYVDYRGSLSLKSVMGYDDEEACKKVLSLWNRIDPPSDVEKNRNNVVQSIQGNRNVFVDYPGLIENMFNIAK